MPANPNKHYTNYLQIKGNGTEAVKFTQDTDKTLNFKAGTNVSISATSGEITISSTDTATAADNILDGSNSETQITYAPYTTQQSKLSFDTSTTNPTRTDRLNLNGYLYATKLYSGGKEVFTSHQNIKSINTNNTAAQTVNANEAIAGSGTINLHKVSKTGSYNDLSNIPVINQDLTVSGFRPVANTYYKHTGSTTSAYIKGRMYYCDGTNLKKVVIVDELPPAPNNGKLTITVNGTAHTFTANQAGDTSFSITDTDTGATSVEVTGAGNAVTSASYNPSTRKLTLTKGTTFQEKLTAGSNITINGNTISAKDTTYTFTANNPTLAWNTTSKIGTIGGVEFNVTMPANPNTHHTNYLQIKGNNTEAVKFAQNADKTLNFKPGANVSISATSGEITISSTDTNTATAADNILDGSNSGTQITYKPYTSQQSKLSFDTSTTNPTRTDRLNLNGYLYATKLYSGGKEVLTSHQNINGKLDKTTYEWNKEFRAGSNGAISLGRYNVYDTQLTFDISSTTSASMSGKLVIATQNGRICQAKVFGDANGVLVSKIVIYQSAIVNNRS